jgi:hypothetical protein
MQNIKHMKIFVCLIIEIISKVKIFLKPPTQTFSMEIVLFLQNIMVHQHLRLIYAEHEQAMAELNNMKTEISNILSEIKASSI